ncbi:PP2C family protein-serine/threonine phosphatase [Conexibacter arvalis]|uniref:Serine phosphatase RsbU (Regulator of sigma subunit) n=1 Tax=Conexibacter arvalis TaxID=912552 RepID=A0A840IFE0_9ACTN|nr:SpoIIE family protein phosphatase [Conexibacter arvalis]MBB4663572.1 serine phosphatase RsbU (regulator of sigma subunit) [Conexibacter arvalis]
MDASLHDALELIGHDRDLLADVLAHAPVGIVLLWGEEHRYRFANERARALLPGGDRLVGLTVAEAFPQTLEASEEVLRRVLRSGETIVQERRPLPSDDPAACEGSIWLDVSYSPVRDRADEIRGVLCLFVDASAHERERRGLSRALAHERDLADALQRGLLAETSPRIPGAEVATRYVPATDGMTVGGDFYDVFRHGDDRWLLTIGDVCGKGADAAALTALVRHTVHAVARYESEPARILHEVNRAICRAPTGRFCTVALVELELSRDRAQATVALGGHPPPLVRRADGDGRAGRVEPVGEPVTLLGVFRDPDLHQRTAALGADDLLLLYTDGLTEARAPRQTTPDQLGAALGATGDAPPGATIDALVHELAAGPDGFRDDLAVVAVRRHAPR